MNTFNVTNSLPLSIVAVVVSAIIALKWIRVAQREHYKATYVLKFAERWFFFRDSGLNMTLTIFMGVGVVAALSRPNVASSVLISFVGVTILSFFMPIGLGFKGRTSKLVWTRRARLLYGVTVAIDIVVGVVSYFMGLSGAVGTILIVATPAVVEIAVRITAPLEERTIQPFVASAQRKLESVNPKRVAITGSYGKTSTKYYVEQICSCAFPTLASPLSYNNRAGLARTINENLLPGTEVFIAEMGTYMPGEIEALTAWIKPDIAAITAIGPVHLERFGSEERILQAKSEICVDVPCIVLNVDDTRLETLANQLERESKKIWRVSGTDFSRSVAVLDDAEGNSVVYYNQKRIGSAKTRVANSNLAVAVAISLELGVAEDVIAGALETLAAPPNRINVLTNANDVVVIDDTYNSNPRGARFALDLAVKKSQTGSRLVVVTPGMVELGERQFEENRLLGKTIGECATDLVIVGLTNQRALKRGALGASLPNQAKIRIIEFRTREKATAWINSKLIGGDIVLYENDLPDHFI